MIGNLGSKSQERMAKEVINNTLEIRGVQNQTNPIEKTTNQTKTRKNYIWFGCK